MINLVHLLKISLVVTSFRLVLVSLWIFHLFEHCLSPGFCLVKEFFHQNRLGSTGFPSFEAISLKEYFMTHG